MARELGVSENAARMRVARAVEALRLVLERRGIHSGSAALSALVAANAVNAAPVGVASSVVAAATGTAQLGAAISILYTMSKAKMAAMATLVAVGAIALFVETQSRQALRGEVVRLHETETALAHARTDAQELQRELERLGGSNPELSELNRVQNRIAILKGRPAGVSDSLMNPIANIGRATPEAAYATFLAAVNAGDFEAVARMVSFRDGPPSERQREEFMSKFDAIIREKYRTPERLFAAAYVGLRDDGPREPRGGSYQVLGQEEIFPGVVQVRLWAEGPNGGRELKDSFQQTPEGWSIVFRPLASRTAAEIRGLLDPATGLPKASQP